LDTLSDLEGLLDTVGVLLTDLALDFGDTFFFTGVASFFLLALEDELTFDEDLENNYVNKFNDFLGQDDGNRLNYNLSQYNYCLYLFDLFT